MKELTIEGKAKRYDEAIERAKEYWDVDIDNTMNVCAKGTMECLFPELKDSEDERIRKALMHHYRGNGCICNNYYRIDYKNIFAWLEKQGKIVEYYEDKLDRCACENFNKGYKKALEKQGEQKPDELVKEYDFHGMEFVPKFKKGDLIREKLSGRILTIKDFSYDNGLYTYDTGQFPITIQDNYEIIEQNSTNEVGNHDHKEVLQTIINEQTPAWSEEDEDGLGDAMWAIEQARTIAKDENDMGNLWYAEHWLKSLKERYAWKPSDEQMEALLKLEEMHVLEHEKNQENAHLYMVVKSIREQLLKLREE